MNFRTMKSMFATYAILFVIAFLFPTYGSGQIPPLFVEHFDGGIVPPWTLSTNQTGADWSATDRTFDPGNPNSVWSAGAVSTGPGYPGNLTNRMISGPIDMSGKTGAELLFSCLPDFETGDRLGVCVSTGASHSGLAAGDCHWFDEPSDRWRYERIDLSPFAGLPVIHIGFVFETGPNGSAVKSGAFVDEIQIFAGEEPVEPPGEEGWEMLYEESFGDIDLANDELWSLVTNQAGTDWSVTGTKYDDSDPDEPRSAAAVSAPHEGYGTGLYNWMILGPVDLSEQKVVELYFSYNMDSEDTDWFGFNVGNGPSASDFDDENISWLHGSTDGWKTVFRELTPHAGKSDVYLAWIFESEAGSASKSGLFVDWIEIMGTAQDLPHMFDHSGDFAQWSAAFSESFDAADLYADPNWTSITNQPGSAWNTTGERFDPDNPESVRSAGISPAGTGYPADMGTWMIYGPVDISNLSSGDIRFGIYYDLESDPGGDPESGDRVAFFYGPAKSPQELADRLAERPPHVRWWSGDSGGVWERVHENLGAFAGHRDIYFGWFFESRVGSASKPGVYVDEIEISGGDRGAPAPEIGFEPGGVKNENGSFDTNSLHGWEFDDPGPGGGVSMRERRGDYYSAISGNQVMRQPFEAAAGLSDLFVSFSYAVDTAETVRGNDRFCVSLSVPGSVENRIVDFGCWDVLDFPEHARTGEAVTNWGRFERSLTEAQIRSIAESGEARLDFAISLEQEGGGETVLFIDNVNVYATGFARRSLEADVLGFAGQRDPAEPNDDFANAFNINCGETVKGGFGDIGGGADYDYYKLVRVPAGVFEIDINARTKQPASAADTYVELYDRDFKLLASNDDDGESLDSRIVYDNPADRAIYYIMVKTAHGGGPEFFYDITVTCGSDAGALSSDRTGKPRARRTSGETWTMMLYLDAEDQDCVEYEDESLCWDKIYEESISRIEEFIGQKQDFLTVIALVDGPNYSDVESDVTRYVIQPDGAYTEDENKWSLDEINMGDPDNLSDFAAWCMTNHPADYYYLVIHDHGHGIFGTAWDYHDAGGEEIDDYLTPAEVRSALKEITNGGESPVDVFEFQSCLMGMLENVYEIKDYANYVAMFQPVSWTSYNYPEYFRDLESGDDPLTVGKRIIQNYPVSDESYPYTFSLIDTSAVTAVREKLDVFAETLTGTDVASIDAVRDESQAFNGNVNKGDPTQDAIGYIDLWYLADRLAESGIAASEAADVKVAVEAAVVETRATVSGGDPLWDYTNYHGLSVLYPMGPFTFIEDYWRDYQMSSDGNWDEFLTDHIFAGYDFGRSDDSETRAEQGRPENVPPLPEKTSFVPTSFVTPPDPACDDGIQNGNETGTDCGGDCDPCPVPTPDGDGTSGSEEPGPDTEPETNEGESDETVVTDDDCFIKTAGF